VLKGGKKQIKTKRETKREKSCNSDFENLKKAEKSTGKLQKGRKT